MAVAILDTEIFPHRIGKGVSYRRKGNNNRNHPRPAVNEGKPTIDNLETGVFPKRIKTRRPKPRGYYA